MSSVFSPRKMSPWTNPSENLRAIRWLLTVWHVCKKTQKNSKIVSVFRPAVVKGFFWRRRTKSLIVAKLLQLVPRGTLSSELFEFFRYLYPFQRYTKFSFFVIFNSACLFENIFLQKLQCLKYFLRWIQICWNF